MYAGQTNEATGFPRHEVTTFELLKSVIRQITVPHICEAFLSIATASSV